MSETAPTRTLGTWLAFGASWWLGVLAWIPPVVTFWFLAMLSGRERWIGFPEMLVGTALVGLLTMAAPAGLMVWRRWRGAAIAFGVGIAVGAVPTVWVVMTFMLIAAR